MGKKNKNNEPLVLDESGILSECASSLMCAFDHAVEHRDVEAMLAVSDRWLRLYDMLSRTDEAEGKLKLGFIGDHNDDQS